MAENIWEYYFNDAARAIESMRTTIQELTAERDKLKRTVGDLKTIIMFLENGDEVSVLE